jgi:hypothetical protein
LDLGRDTLSRRSLGGRSSFDLTGPRHDMSRDETGWILGLHLAFYFFSSIYSHVGCFNVHGYHVFILFLFWFVFFLTSSWQRTKGIKI